MKRFFLYFFLLVVCVPVQAQTVSYIHQPTTFTELPAWEIDDHFAALTAFQNSCSVWQRKNPRTVLQPDYPTGKTISAWLPACAAARKVQSNRAKSFFETHFTPYKISSQGTTTGTLTGYYVSSLEASPNRSSVYSVPIYGLPKDLIPGKGKTDWYRRDTHGSLVPYYTRAEIDNGAIAATAPVLYWAKNKIDVFFLSVQGSGVLTLPNGQTVMLGFAGRNGRPYTGIGKELIKRGALTPETTTMQTIRAWLEQHPHEADALMHKNENYIFFRKMTQKTALGAMGVGLTPEHSIAVDPRYIPYGVPLWVSVQPNNRLPEAFSRLMLAQDTGAAIKGPLRGDFFWGFGDHAATQAGKMHNSGTFTVLLPKQP